MLDAHARNLAYSGEYPENSISEALAVYIQKQQDATAMAGATTSAAAAAASAASTVGNAMAMAGATTSAAASTAASYFSPQQVQAPQNRHYYPNQPYLHTPNLLSLHPNFLWLPSFYALQQQNYALQLQQQQMQQQVHQLQKKVKTIEQKEDGQEAAIGLARLGGTSPESSLMTSSPTATDNATDNTVADDFKKLSKTPSETYIKMMTGIIVRIFNKYEMVGGEDFVRKLKGYLNNIGQYGLGIITNSNFDRNHTESNMVELNNGMAIQCVHWHKSPKEKVLVLAKETKGVPTAVAVAVTAKLFQIDKSFASASNRLGDGPLHDGFLSNGLLTDLVIRVSDSEIKVSVLLLLVRDGENSDSKKGEG